MKNLLTLIIIIANILIPCLSAEEIAKDKTLYIQASKPIKKETLLSENFIINKMYGKRMLYSDDKEVFLTYIFLLKYYNGDPNGQVETDYKSIRDYIYPDIEPKKSDEKISKILNILYKKYELIDFDRYLKENLKIKLYTLNENHLPYSYPKLDFVVIPETLWTFGWDKRLSFTGLFTYMINLMETKLSPFDSHWEIDPDMLALRYNISTRQIQQGLEELQQYNLLEAVDTKEKNIFDGNPIIKYRILPLYSYENIEKQWQNIKENYKNKDIEKATDYAGILFKKYDPNTVEEILKLTKKYPPSKLKKAFKILDEKPAYAPERSLSYLNEIINNI